jgi:hypothetical protein
MQTSLNVRIAFTLWLAGMLGSVVLATTFIPQVLAQTPVPVPISPTLVIAISVLQTAAMLALACWAGVSLARPLGLGAPVLEAAWSGNGSGLALTRQLLPATVVGVIAAALLVFLTGVAPEPIRVLSGRYEIPLLARVLYGGITEEILLRWGLMTVLMWLAWRILQQGAGRPRGTLAGGAIVLSALAFAAGHLPAVIAMGAPLDAAVIAFVMIGNTIPGLLFGLLYWRYGIEAAILAHMLAHLLSAFVM